MKTSHAVILATILGVAAGMGTALLRLGLAPWDGNPVGAGVYSGGPDMPRPGDPTAKVVVDHVQHDFGKMDVDGEGSHDFIFSNEGDAPLVLTEGATSCKCTGIEIKQSEVPPGESAKATLTWKAEGSTSSYQETAIVHTNDPARPQVTLTISGRVTEVIRTVPPKLVFYSVSAGESTTREIPLYCYLDQPLEIAGIKLSDQRIADKFEVAFEPLGPNELKNETDAQSGYLVKVTLKPGLPLGTFEQTILIGTNLESASSVVIPILGKVTGDITVVGQGWNEEANLLRLGTLNSEKGARRQLNLFARGPHRKEVDFQIIETFPKDLLQAKLEKTREINEGRSSQTPLIIEIPKGSRPANHLTSKQGKIGRILIKTGHPQIPQLNIRVSFAVKG